MNKKERKLLDKIYWDIEFNKDYLFNYDTGNNAWELTRSKYKILNSEDNSVKELESFYKTHRQRDVFKEETKFMLIFTWLLVIIWFILNLYFCNKEITEYGFIIVFSIEVFLLMFGAFRNIIINKNIKAVNKIRSNDLVMKSKESKKE